MNKIILFFVFSILCVSCVYPIVNREKFLSLDKYMKNLHKTTQIQLFPIIPQCKFKEDSLELAFFSYNKLSLEEARWFINESVAKLIKNIEINSNIFCFSNNFKLENLKFTIIFLKSNGDYVGDGYIAFAYLHKGIVDYSYNNSSTKLFEDALTEPLTLSNNEIK